MLLKGYIFSIVFCSFYARVIFFNLITLTFMAPASDRDPEQDLIGSRRVSEQHFTVNKITGYILMHLCTLYTFYPNNLPRDLYGGHVTCSKPNN